jgi:hypothetical protein
MLSLNERFINVVQNANTWLLQHAHHHVKQLLSPVQICINGMYEPRTN